MTKNGRQLKDLSRADISLIIPLHQASLADIGAILGSNYLSRFYNLLFSAPDHCLLGVFEKDKLIALLAGSFDLSKTHLKLAQLIKAREILMIVINILYRKISPGRIFERLQLEKFLFRKIKENSGGVAVLLVKDKYRRQGIGRWLIDEFFRRCRKRKINEVFVDTLESFPGASAFYQSSGFSILNSFGKTKLFYFKL